MSAPNHLPVSATGAAAPCRYAVSLVDRHTRRPHMIAGIPLVLMTREPGRTARELLRHRDIARWDTLIEPMTRNGAVQ